MCEYDSRPAGGEGWKLVTVLTAAAYHAAMKRILLAWLLTTLALATAGAADGRLPIFDAHVHYSAPDWGTVSPEEVVRRMDAAGVRWSLVSSTPDDGTIRLHGHAPGRFVPELRPYKGEVRSHNWFASPGVPAYLEARLTLGVHKGIGEFHLLTVEAAHGPSARKVLEMAAARGLWLHIHCPAQALRAYLADAPKVKVLWAHAGMSDPPEVVGRLLDDFPDVVTELSFRADEIYGDGPIAPAWRDLLTRHAGRFLIGTDTYITERWAAYGSLVDAHRAYLAALPREVAEAIAWRNAIRLFGLKE